MTLSLVKVTMTIVVICLLKDYMLAGFFEIDCISFGYIFLSF